MFTRIRVEGRKDELLESAKSLNLAADKFRRGETTADILLEQMMVNFYHLATAVSLMFNEIECGLRFRNGSGERGAVLASMIMCI